MNLLRKASLARSQIIVPHSTICAISVLTQIAGRYWIRRIKKMHQGLRRPSADRDSLNTLVYLQASLPAFLTLPSGRVMLRKTNFQNLAFFFDLYSRGLLDLDPAYQRRSIWSQRFKDFFIDTVVNNYPCPAIFLYEEISPSGTAKYHVVDGKQRLLTCFEFADNKFPVYERTAIVALRGQMFREFSDAQKLDFWRYQFPVEFVPQEDERLITEIFDRINRNVARLTRQELRHAKYDGDFMQEVEAAADKMAEILPPNVPAIASQSKRQMKDMEFVGNLLLLVQEGPRSYSQDQLDAAYSDRDESWEERETVARDFTASIVYIAELLRADTDETLSKSRIKNQADFYSLVGAVNVLIKSGRAPEPSTAARRLRSFIDIVDDESRRNASQVATSYYAAARSASNDQGPRQTRVNMIVGVLSGEIPVS